MALKEAQYLFSNMVGCIPQVCKVWKKYTHDINTKQQSQCETQDYMMIKQQHKGKS